MKKSILYKGLLEPIILQLIKDNSRMYGFEITQKVKIITDGKLNITEGALYPLLHRLEVDGILEVKNETVGNRIRKYYSLTKSGHKQSKGAFIEVLEFISTLNLVFNSKLS